MLLCLTLTLKYGNFLNYISFFKKRQSLVGFRGPLKWFLFYLFTNQEFLLFRKSLCIFHDCNCNLLRMLWIWGAMEWRWFYLTCYYELNWGKEQPIQASFLSQHCLKPSNWQCPFSEYGQHNIANEFTNIFMI